MTVADDLATLRENLHPTDSEGRAALDRVEAEIARLQLERDAYKEECADWERGADEELARAWKERAEAAEAEVARLRDGLRRIAPYDLRATDWDYHGHRLVPSGIADELIEHIEHARALLAENGTATCKCPSGSYNPDAVHEPYCPLAEDGAAQPVSYEFDGEGWAYARYANGEVLPTGYAARAFAGKSNVTPARFAEIAGGAA